MQAALKGVLAVGAILGWAVPGQTIGPDGYQKLTGHAYGELDPRLPLNAMITDLELALRNARGMVEYVATFTLPKPGDMAKASGVLLYFVPSQGNRLRVSSHGR